MLAFLGQGGFGITYEAEQVSLHRRVAIKEFFMKDCCERDGATSRVTVGTGSQRELVSKFRGKFIREAQMIASFEHAHIVRIHDVFEENGTAYYVMENLPGGSLADRIKKEGPLSEAAAEKYIRQVADALDYIHSHGTVHLDVKPSNILLSAKGDAVLIDFGISKHYDKAGEQTSSTPVGISKGYAPLEQGRDGDVSQFTPATDIYSLGATLFYLVTGQVPPEASIVNEDGMERPTGISERVWNAVESAMQPRRKDRPQSVGDFLRLLDGEQEANIDDSEETVLTGSTSKPTGTPQPRPEKLVSEFPTPKPPRRGLWIALASGVAALALVLLLLPRHKPEPTIPTAQTDSLITEPPLLSGQQNPQAPQAGSARINSTPSGAQIWLDGKNTKRVTPEILEDIPEGKHRIKLVLDGYEDYSGSISISAGKRAELSQNLKAKEKPPQQSGSQSGTPPPADNAGSSGTTAGATSGTINGHEWVDLGLSVKWATCNVGASSPSDYGGYYAWGETATKSDYSGETYKYRVSGEWGENATISKYNTESEWGIVDNKTRLDRTDDAARANWGGTWRMATYAEWTELRTKCKWIWTSQGGHNGYKVTGPNGNSIFLPAAGGRYGTDLGRDDGSYGYYWSSDLDNSSYAAGCDFDSGDVNGYSNNRCYGFSVRPVTE